MQPFRPRTARIGVAPLIAAALLAALVSSAVAQDSVRRAPVQQLPPGYVVLARVPTPEQGPVTIYMHRIRYLGKVALCVGQTPNVAGDQPHGGPATCANYPIGSNVTLEASRSLWQTGGVAQCNKATRPVKRLWALWSAVILRPGLTAWLRTPNGLSRLTEAVVPPAFHVAGPLIYTRLTKPSAIILRDAKGRTVATFHADLNDSAC